VYYDILNYFVDLAERDGLTIQDMADALGVEKEELQKLFSEPKDWTLAQISDLLLAMGAELKHKVVPIDE